MKCVAELIDEENYKRLTSSPFASAYRTFTVTVVSNVSHDVAAECGFRFRDKYQNGFPRLVSFKILDDDE